MKKTSALVLLLLTVLLVPGAGPGFAQAPDAVGSPRSVVASGPPPPVTAASAIVVDGSDGSILWEKDARRRRAIASTTKIVTALAVLENADLDEQVTASPRAEAVGEDDPLVTELELVSGEVLTVRDLLYGLLLPSGNDAAVALAEHVGGTVEGFAGIMNETAAAAGAGNSNFVNPHGLDDPEAYSTAYDLALITRAALDNPVFAEIVATHSHTIPRSGGPTRELVNRNQLLGRLEGATGVKTGNTQSAGPSLVASASRAGESRIAVVLDSPDTFGEAAELLEYGFSAFRRVTIVAEGRPWGQLTYGDGTTVSLVADRGFSLLVGNEMRAPRVRFRPFESDLLVDVDDGLQIPLQSVCPGTEERCGKPDSRYNLLAGLISLFRPVLGLFR